MIRSSRLALVAILALAAALFAMPASASAFGPLSSFGSEGEGAGQLKAPGGLGVAPDGSTYVADYGLARVDVFSPQGDFLFAFGKKVNVADSSDLCTAASGCKAGTTDGTAGSLGAPEGVAFDPQGNVYVANTGYARVDVFSPQGAFLFAFGKKVNVADESNVCTAASGCKAGTTDGTAGALSGPTGLGFDSSSNLYVANAGYARVDVFSPQGAFLFAFGKKVNVADSSNVCTAASGCKAGTADGTAGALSGPHDVEVASNGLLAISDPGNRRVDVFTSQGAFVRAFGKEVNPSAGDVCTAASTCQAASSVSKAAGSTLAPVAVAVDGSGGVYVSDLTLDRIAQFTIDGAFVRAFGQGVIDGAATFQICTVASGCKQGTEATASGAIPNPYGVATDCRGAVYAIAEMTGLSRVERFGEPGTAAPPCPPPSPAPSPAPVPPSNKFKFGKLKLNKKTGTATLSVNVPAAGKLVLKGKGVKKVTKSAKKAGNVKLPVKPIGKSKAKLAETGKVKITAKLTFSPTGGSPLTKTKGLKLKKTLP